MSEGVWQMADFKRKSHRVPPFLAIQVPLVLPMFYPFRRAGIYSGAASAPARQAALRSGGYLIKELFYWWSWSGSNHDLFHATAVTIVEPTTYSRFRETAKHS